MDDSFKAFERRYQLFTLLMSGRHPTMADLVDRFHVARRTIFRDLSFLEEMRVPIIRAEGRYWVDEGYRIPPVQLQPQEVLVLKAALDFCRRNRALGSISAAQSVEEKLLAALPRQEQQMAVGLDQTLVVEPVQAHSVPPLPEVEEALRTALAHRNRVRIRYQALAAESPTERVVRPYGLAYRGVALYLIGFCELRNELRHFRANRIQKAEVLSDTFDRPADFDLDAYLRHMWEIEYGPQMTVRIRFYREAAQLARETIWHPTQQLQEEAGGSVILTMTTRGKNELARWLAGFGGSAEVLDPPELREAVLALGQGTVARLSGR